jgi:hypothetical protein
MPTVKQGEDPKCKPIQNFNSLSTTVPAHWAIRCLNDKPQIFPPTRLRFLRRCLTKIGARHTAGQHRGGLVSQVHYHIQRLGQSHPAARDLPILRTTVFLGIMADPFLRWHEDHARRTSLVGVAAVVSCTADHVLAHLAIFCCHSKPLDDFFRT